MNCGSCSAVCEINNTGICLGCQRGFVNLPQEDAWVKSEERAKAVLEHREKEREVELRSTGINRKVARVPHSKRKKVN